MALHVTAPLTLVVLELPTRRPKCIAQRDIGIFVSGIRRVGVPDRDLLVAKRDIDPEVVLVSGGQVQAVVFTYARGRLRRLSCENFFGG